MRRQSAAVKLSGGRSSGAADTDAFAETSRGRINWKDAVKMAKFKAVSAAGTAYLSKDGRKLPFFLRFMLTDALG